MPEPRGPSDFVDAAYRIENEADMVEFYRKWAADYDHQMLDVPLQPSVSQAMAAQSAAKLFVNVNSTRSPTLTIICGIGIPLVIPK